jgi:hypothetical protein
MDSEVIAIQLWLVGMQHYHRLWCYGPLWPFIELIVPAMGCYDQKQVLLMNIILGGVGPRISLSVDLNTNNI